MTAGLAAGRQVAVRWPDGTVVGDPDAVLPAEVPTTATTVDVDGGTVVVQPVARDGGTAVVTVRVPDEVLHAGVLRTWLVLGGLGLVLFTLALLVADRLARSLTRPVSELAATADRLGRGELDARVDPAGPGDIRAVGTAVNRLAGRIGELLTAERENAADLAHRLRTPLTALRLDVDALPDGPARDRLVDDVDELSRTVDAVISDARRPVREGLQAQCDAVAVVADRVAFWSVLAEDEDRAVDVDLAPGPLPVRLPATDLAAAVDALLGNVFAHTPPGTPFSVAVAPRPAGVPGSWWPTAGPACTPPRRCSAGSPGAARPAWAWTSPGAPRRPPAATPRWTATTARWSCWSSARRPDQRTSTAARSGKAVARTPPSSTHPVSTAAARAGRPPSGPVASGRVAPSPATGRHRVTGGSPPRSPPGSPARSRRGEGPGRRSRGRAAAPRVRRRRPGAGAGRGRPRVSARRRPAGADAGSTTGSPSGRMPVSSWWPSTPTAQTSSTGVAGAPRSRSGERYSRVPAPGRGAARRGRRRPARCRSRSAGPGPRRRAARCRA